MCFYRGTVWRCPCGFLRRRSFWAGLNLWRGAALNFLQTLTSGWRPSGANGINSRLVSLFSLLYEHVFSNAAKELRNIRAQSITSVRGPFVERKCFLNSRLSKSALLWHRWVSHLETDLSLIQSYLPRWEETGGLGRFGGERDAENARKTWEGIVRIKMLRKCILKHFCLKASFTSNWYMSKLPFLVLFWTTIKISLCNVSALLW